MLAVTFLWKSTDIVASNFLLRTSEPCKEKVWSLLFLKRRKLDKNLQNDTATDCYSSLKKVKQIILKL